MLFIHFLSFFTFWVTYLFGSEKYFGKVLIGAHKRATAKDTGAVEGVVMTRTDSDIVLQQETHQNHHQMGEMAIKVVNLSSLGSSQGLSSSHAFLHAREASLSQVATFWRGNGALWPALNIFYTFFLPLDHNGGSEAVTKGISAGHKAEVTGHFRGGDAGWLALVKENHL
jgi:hypothetical protein